MRLPWVYNGSRLHGSGKFVILEVMAFRACVSAVLIRFASCSKERTIHLC